MRLWACTYQIFKKDMISEIRTRYVVNSLLMFVIIIISVIRFSIGNEIVSEEVLAGLLWIAIFFSASSGLARVFIKEEEKETSLALKLSVGTTEIFLGKLLFNFVLTFALNIVIVIFFILISGLHITDTGGFIIILLLGNTGLVAASTIIAAIISKANSKGTLYPVLSFPVLLPLLLSVINGTKLSVTGTDFSELLPDIQILISYSVVVITASILVFRFIWED
ncbi:MAG: heme exporter protein CcmB [Ignavibacteria bacterium]|nr:heme exporter protein CcmB [Ignavibacteria bacterium]